MVRIQTADDIAMNAYQILAFLFLSDKDMREVYSDEEVVRILDWFAAAVDGTPIGDLEKHKSPLPEFEGEPEQSAIMEI